MTTIPPCWTWVELSDVVEILDKGRVPVSAKERELRRGSVPYYGAAGQVGWIDKPLYDEDLVLLGEDGVQFFDPGKSKSYLITGPAWVNNHAHVLRAQSRLIDRHYLCHYLNVFNYRGYANGTTRLKLTQSAMRSIPVPLPSLPEQRRIAATLEDYLSNLDAAMKVLISAGRRAQSLWQSMLNSVVMGNSADPSSEIKFKSIVEVAQVQGGIQKQPKRRPTRNTFPFLRVANVSRGGLDLSDVHKIELFEGEIERYRLEDGDLLVVEGNGSQDQIGRAAMWRNEIPDCVHQNHLIRVRPGPELDSRYLEYVWNAPETAQKLRSVASSTSGLFTLSTLKVKSMKVPVPPRSTQERLVAEAERGRTHLDAAEQSIKTGYRRADSLRRSLLAEAFAGRLVEQDPADKPASVLLERIREERAAHGMTQRRKPGRGQMAPQKETLL